MLVLEVLSGWWMLPCGLMSSWILHITCKSCEQFCQLSKIIDEFSIVTYKARESTYVLVILWWSHNFSGFHFQWYGFYTYCVNDMAQILIFWQRSGICTISRTTLHCGVCGKHVVDGLDALLQFCCQWLCHPHSIQVLQDIVYEFLKVCWCLC